VPYILQEERRWPMRITHHMHARMNQRGMNQTIVDMVLAHGEQNDDRIVMSKRHCQRLIEDLKRQQKALETIARKGGVCVVEAGGALITTYWANSFSASKSKTFRD
jgi:hypothetical protein